MCQFNCFNECKLLAYFGSRTCVCVCVHEMINLFLEGSRENNIFGMRH